MKKLLLITFMFLIGHNAFSQIAYQDAADLAKYVKPQGTGFKTDTASLNRIAAILKKYCTDLPPVVTWDDVKSAITTNNPANKNYNPILTPLFSGTPGLSSSSVMAAEALPTGGLGGLDVSTVADGIAKFLIKRGKQELSIAFFQKFKAVIDKDKDLSKLFPTTTTLLDAIDQEVYNYSVYLQNLRDAFKTDITALPKNLPEIVQNHTAYFNARPALKAEFLAACYLAAQLQDHAHPGDIIANLPDSILTQLDAITTNQAGTKHYVKGAIQTVQLFNSALRNSDTSANAPYWVSAAQVKALLNDMTTFRIFMGLVYQDAKVNYGGVVFDGNISLVSILDNSAAVITKNGPVFQSYKTYITEFAGQLDQMNKQIKNYESLPSDSVSFDKYTSYARAAVKLIEKASDVGNLKCLQAPAAITPVTIYASLGLPDMHSFMQPYFNVSYQATDLVADVATKNYSGAINNAALIYNELAVKPLADEANAASDANTKKALTNQHDAASDTFAAFMKYGSFMAAVATAKTSDDVEAAIEAAALPVGSYTVKQKSVFNISLNAYVGYGWDFSKVALPLNSKNLYANGIYAPVGFSASLGGKKGNGAVTLFASLIDVGSLVAYNLGADSTKKLKQTIRLESIFSPSAQLSYEIPGWPLAVMAGWRRAPKLFFSNDTDFKVVDPHGVFNLSLLIDIPIFTLHNEQRK